MRKHIKFILIALTASFSLLSCEQERLAPILTTADGGGTLTEYMAYTIASTDTTTTNIYGRVVFWKDGVDRTLVQLSLYNTVAASTYPAKVVGGLIGAETTTLMELDAVSGDTGEFSTSKFYVIADTGYYDAISALDAHVNILQGDTIVATGNIGANSTPVETN